MAVFKVNLTDDGKVLLARANAGEQMSIVAIVLGSGVWTEEQQTNFNLSALVEQKMSLGIASSSRTGEVYNVQAVLSNASLVSGFAVRELGVIVEIEDAGVPTEYLYLAGYAGDQYTYIVDKDTAPVSYPVPVTIVVGRTENITVEIADQVFATKEDIITHDADPDAHQPLVDRLHVSTPAITSPDPGQLDVIETPAFLSTAFESHFAGVGHTHSQFQVDVAAGDWTTPVHDSGADAVNLTSYTMPSGVLDAATVYKARVRHKCGPDGLWSEWSPVITFTTLGDFVYVEQPTNTLPVAAATDVEETPTFESSAFAVTGGSDTQDGAEFRILLGGSVVHTSTGLGAVTSYVVPAGVLSVSTEYTWDCRYSGVTEGWGERSTPTTFTTTAVFFTSDDAVVFDPATAADWPIIQTMDTASGLVATADDAYAYSDAEVQGGGESNWGKLAVQVAVKDPEELTVDGTSTTDTLVLTSGKSGLLADGDKVLLNDGAAGTTLTEHTLGNVVESEGTTEGDLCTGGTATGVLENGGLISNPAANAFDDDNATNFYCYKSAAAVLPVALEYDFGTTKVVTGYTLTCGPNYPPKTWTFDGWNGSSWVQLDAQSGITGWGTDEKKSYTISNVVAYQKYRIRVTESDMDPGVYQILIHEMEMLGVIDRVYTCSSITPALPAVPGVTFLPVPLWEADGADGDTWDGPEDFTAIALASASYVDNAGTKTITLTSEQIEPAQSFRQVALGVSGLPDGAEITAAQINLDKIAS